MTVYPNEPASEYHAREAFSAGMAQNINGPDGCLALAKYRCRWTNPDFHPERDEALDNGTLAHALILEPERLDSIITVIQARDFRSKAAQELRDEAYLAGKVPILYERPAGATGASFLKLMTMRKALENSLAAPLLWGEGGHNEVSYTWTQDGVPCKARADRLIPIVKAVRILDLKTAISASPEAFKRSTVYWGHHMRAAFYMDGWRKQPKEPMPFDYLFIVVQKEPPHVVSVFKLTERAEQWGRALYLKALSAYDKAMKSGEWPGYASEIRALDLPVWAEHQLADAEAAGDFL